MTSDSTSIPQRGGMARYFVEHRGIGWLALVVVMALGWISYRSLPQQEDPTFPTHDAMLVTIWPGATALQMEQLVTRRIEDALGEMASVELSGSQSRANISIVYVLQRSASKERILQEWDNMRAKLRELPLPEGCRPTTLDADYQATATLLFAITSPLEGDAAKHSYRTLETEGERLMDQLKRLGSVGRIRMFGNPKEQIELRFSASKMAEGQVAPEDLLKAIQARNTVTPGGFYLSEGRSLPVQISGQFSSEQEVEQLMVGVAPDDEPIRLKDILEVRRGYEDPLPFTVETLHRESSGALQASRSVLLAVEMKEGSVIGDFNQQVQSVIHGTERGLPAGMKVITVSDQPQQAKQRITQFVRCFVEAVVIVVLMALLLMDWRSALVVALAIPLTIAVTLAGMALLQIPLQQISIAALIISLGMLVDDPVVACDGINRELAAGRQPGLAAWLGPFKLRRAIFFGTVINIVAFLPLALLPGDKGAFIVALPIVVSLALLASRLVSVTFVPLLSFYVLKGQSGLERHAGSAVYKRLLQGSLRRPVLVLVVGYGLLAASFALPRFFGKQFFPPAERNQLLIDVALPDSASVSKTREVMAKITALLQSHPEITTAGIITGGTAPNFYYNVLPRVPAPWLGQVIINTYSADEVPSLVAKLRQQMDAKVPEARCIVKQLEQGPAMETPIQIRVSGDDLGQLRKAADSVSAALITAGAYQVHDDLGQPAPMLNIVLDQDKANAKGVTSAHVGSMAQATFFGLPVGEVREGGHVLPLVFRVRPEERGDLAAIRQLPVPSMRGEAVTLSSVAEVQEKEIQPVVCHYDRQRTATVKAMAPLGDLPSRVLERAGPQLDSLALPQSYRLEYGGERKELATAQSEMAVVMGLSLGLISLSLLIQFGSVRKALVVMLTVPLGLVGAFFGLAVTHAPFGFMALLGIVSLAGVVVSHIIVMSDFIEEALAAGVELREALVEAGLVRLRAVLVTVMATVCGLIPLALSGSQLWQPLTAVHIFGLLFATALTLLVLPVLYYLVHRRRITSSER